MREHSYTLTLTIFLPFMAIPSSIGTPHRHSAKWHLAQLNPDRDQCHCIPTKGMMVGEVGKKEEGQAMGAPISACIA